ncbi:agarase [Pedobacter frigiditerrae]|uniref:Agarase n=1 Tax=Pedobacter frigiditerrae TaxID=2530452 RepID=A0A4R0N067_9SPHI|nr:agarase [Pedobacter frigiditerrae]TCC91664.1 agarase [Pedobacter frigiditerrae]
MRNFVAVFTGLMIMLVHQVMAQDSLDFNQKVEVRKVLNNSSEKASFTAYKTYSTRTLSSLSQFKSKKIRTDKYGGRMDRKEKATGFYYTKKIGDRWWVIDPQGYLFIHNALNAVSMGSSDRNKAAFAKLYGDEDNWMVKTQAFLIDNGFNGTGAWSNTKAIQKSPLQQTKPLAYTINLDFMSAYGDKRGGTYIVPGHKGYPNNVIFVFDAAFEAFCDQAAKKLVANSTDANLFGYFSDNEMPLGIKNLDGYLTLKDKQDPGYLTAKKFIDDRGVAADKITDVDRREFLSIVADKYFSIVSKAIKKYDPNHMYLGCRFHGNQGNIAELWKAAGKYIDAISMNYYNAWTPDQTLMANWANWSGKPFIITEWYVKADDSELGNTAGAGWVVKTQHDRGLFYQNFTLSLIESKNCVGWHWFKYMDNDPLQKGAEPSNTNANKGIVDNNYQVYKPLIEKMNELNYQMYQLIDFFDKKKKSP